MDIILPPVDEYRDRIRQRRHHAFRYANRLRRRWKLQQVCVFSLIGYVVFDPTVVAILPPAAVLFIPVVVSQLKLSRKLRREWLAARYFERALLRIEGGWIGDGDSGEQYLRSDDLFAGDLDIFGQGSLFQFLCTARTSSGKDTLANWLHDQAEVDEILERQNAIRELCADVDLRERLAVVELNENRFQPKTLSRWSKAPELFSGGAMRIAGQVLAYALFVGLMAWLVSGRLVSGPHASGWGTSLLMCLLLLQLSFYILCRRRIRAVSADAYYAMTTMSVLSRFGYQLRDRSFSAPYLARIAASFSAEQGLVSKAVIAAYGIVGAFPLPLCLLCQAVPQCERWRRTAGKRALCQLELMGEIQALVSLSQYAYQQSDSVFPEIVGVGECFDAEALGHPLIAVGDRVTNDVRLDEDLRLLLVSGSNMSGKSTLLRTVGINAILALSGAPVCAAKLRISSFAIGTAMRFQDSLEHGSSYFLAVIVRLRSIMELLEVEERPLLFLIDEILQGTNSHDRLIGAEALIRKLVAGGALGIVTTHDLELTRIVDGLGKRATNVHFVDEVIDGEIRFNYKMRPGVVKTSNALSLMRKMGLDV